MVEMKTGEHWPRDIKRSTQNPDELINSLYREVLGRRPYLRGPTAKHCDDLLACLELMGATTEFEED